MRPCMDHISHGNLIKTKVMIKRKATKVEKMKVKVL
jgi:hypothetical protein